MCDNRQTRPFGVIDDVLTQSSLQSRHSSADVCHCYLLIYFTVIASSPCMSGWQKSGAESRIVFMLGLAIFTEFVAVLNCTNCSICLQCFDAVGLVAGMASSL